MSSHFYIELIKIDLEDKSKYMKRWEESLGREISFKQWSVIWCSATATSITILKRKDKMLVKVVSYFFMHYKNTHFVFLSLTIG